MQNEEKRKGRRPRNGVTSDKWIKMRATAAEVEDLEKLCTAMGMTQSEAIRAGLALLAGKVDDLSNWIIAEGVPAADGILTAETDLGPYIKAGDVLALVLDADTRPGAIWAAMVDRTAVVGPVYPGEGGAELLYPYGIGHPVELNAGNVLGRVAGYFHTITTPSKTVTDWRKSALKQVEPDDH